MTSFFKAVVCNKFVLTKLFCRNYFSLIFDFLVANYKFHCSLFKVIVTEKQCSFTLNKLSIENLLFYYLGKMKTLFG